MPSIRALYNDELVEAHREAVAALRELLAEEKDPLERRKLANAILRAHPAKDDSQPLSPGSAGDRAFGSEADESRKPMSTRSVNPIAGFAAADEGALSPAPRRRAPAIHSDDLDDDNDFDDLSDPAHREIDALAHQAQHGPHRLAALGKLHAIMTDNMTALTPSAGAAEGP